MRLHRLTVRNFRGVTDRTVEFPDDGDRGVVVLHGSNEIGKSTLIEALDLLLDEKDTSTKAAVRAVQPVTADVGSVVEADLTVGVHRFVYRKQFNRSPATVLTVLAPTRENLSGSAAHERVRGLLSGAVDLGLWKALRVMQSDPEQPDLARSSTLAGALDRAAGRLGADAGTGQPVLDAVAAEYGLYFTPTGRPTGVLRDVESRLGNARTEAARTATELAQVDQEVARHDAVHLRVEELRLQVIDAAEQVVVLRRRSAAAEELRAVWRSASAAGAAARATLDEAERRHLERSGQIKDLEKWRTAVADATARSGRLEGELAAAEQAVADAGEAVGIARANAVQAREAFDLARAEADRARDRADAVDLTTRLVAVAEAEQKLSAAEREIAANVIDDGLLDRFERAGSALAAARAKQEAGSARLRLVAHVPVQADGIDIVVGAPAEVVVDRDIDLVLPGMLELSVQPGPDAAALADAASRAQELLDELRHETGADSLAAARIHHQARVRAVEQATAARQRLVDALRGATRKALAEQAAALTERLSAGAPGPAGPELHLTAADARTRLTAAEQADRAARAAVTASEQQSVATTTRHRELAARRAQLRESLAAASSVLADITERHEAALAEVSTGELTEQMISARAEAQALEVSERECRARWTGAESAHLPAELAAAEATQARLEKALRAAELELEAARSRLQFLAELGRQDADDAARTELEAAEREHQSVTGRARAAKLLLETLRRHQLAVRTSYVEPFRQALVRLGRVVFGSDFDVTVDAGLRVIARSLNGATVAFEQLSTGAQEQLALLVRVAAAGLVDPVDGIPVFFDDALGHSDPERLAAMGEALAGAGGGCQLILLTGNPERYRGLRGARFLPVGADASATLPVPFGRGARELEGSPPPGPTDTADARTDDSRKTVSGRRSRSGRTVEMPQPEPSGAGLFDLPGDRTAINT